jgi:hypothetical protein
MGFSSQSGQVGFGVQSVKGTAVAATRFAKLRSGGLGGDRSLLVPDPEIGGHRDIPEAYLGPVSFGGDLEFYPRPQMTALLMRAALGAVSTTGTAPVHTHVITPADTVPWLTVEERIGNGFASLRYTDCKVNSIRLEAEATGYLMGSCNVIGIGGVTNFTHQANPVWDETPMMVGGQVAITFGGASLPAKSFSFEVNNNIETDDFVLGSLSLGALTEKRRELSMSLNYRPQDNDLWRAALWGATGLNTAQAGPAYRGAVTITINTFEKITGSTPYSIAINIPHAVVAPHKVTPSGDDVIGSDIEITPIRPAAGTPIVTVTVVNNIATAT